MRAFFEVHLRLVITVWVILLSVLSLLYLMNYMKFDSLMSHVVSSKLEVISSSLANSVERVERLGIPYQSAKNLKQQIDQARIREPNVVAVALIDQHGQPLVQSYADNSPVQTLPEDVVRRALKSSEPRWTLSDDSELYITVSLYLVSLDASQSEIGRIMMIYSLVIIPLSPIDCVGIADRTRKMRELIVLGTILLDGILVSLYGEASHKIHPVG
ncbi:hypothetical protein [Vibrio furnissii]|uniref:hypothetical protein n=1 Tax=Vibrio furnissii TaxID=29494 RepID=UPI001EEB3805|nr:hypothetical protein [Vibrio furnissii]